MVVADLFSLSLNVACYHVYGMAADCADAIPHMPQSTCQNSPLTCEVAL